MYNVNAKNKLIQATKKLLWQQGYESTSPRDIQREAGAGQGSFYHHFGSKSELASVALQEVSDELIEAFDRILAEAEQPSEQLRAYLICKRDVLKGCKLGRLSHEASISDPLLREPIARYFEYVEARLQDVIRASQAAGTLSEHLRPEELATTLLAIVQGGYVLSRVQQSRTPMKRAIAGALSLLNLSTQKP